MFRKNATIKLTFGTLSVLYGSFFLPFWSLQPSSKKGPCHRSRWWTGRGASLRGHAFPCQRVAFDWRPAAVHHLANIQDTRVEDWQSHFLTGLSSLRQCHRQQRRLCSPPLSTRWLPLLETREIASLRLCSHATCQCCATTNAEGVNRGIHACK